MDASWVGIEVVSFSKQMLPDLILRLGKYPTSKIKFHAFNVRIAVGNL